MHHPTDRISHTMAFVTPVVEHRLEREIAQWVIMKDDTDLTDLISVIKIDVYLYENVTAHLLIFKKRKTLITEEGNVLFNDALNTFYLRLYGVRHMVKDHSDSEKGNVLLRHGLLFPINSKGSFICT